MEPVQIKLLEKKKLFIKWNDDSESLIKLETLRKLCPCATCVTERERQSKTYIPILNKNQIEISGINQVGSYAVSITWKDGHNTGIYEFSYLKKLGEDLKSNYGTS
ncbi:MAG: gamma-butyrobetaine hydroxylase-like domain-containing protein [Ignavibacteria bacterium]